MTGKVFRGSADGDRGFKDLETHIGPFSCGFKVHASGGQGVDEFSASCFESICANEDWARNFICFQKLDCLARSIYTENIKRRGRGITSATENMSRNFRARYVL